ncbi:MAG: hypothetical protein ACYC63_15210 [Armatimonadota bacterium]
MRSLTIALMLVTATLLLGCRQPAAVPSQPTTTASQPAAVPIAPAQPQAAPADEAAARNFAASALGFNASKIGSLTVATGRPIGLPTEQRWTGQCDGRRLHVNYLTQGVWSAMLLGKGDLKSASPTTLEAAQRTAEATARRMWGDDYSRLTMTSAKQLPMKQFMFAWQEQLGPGVRTGNDASVMIAPGGRLLSYGEHRAVRRVKPEDVRVSKEEALKIAQQAIATQYKGQTKITETTLLLSSHLSPDRGPLWTVSYHMLTPINGKLQTTAANSLWIDAMTGKEIDMGEMLGYGRRPNAPAASEPPR